MKCYEMIKQTLVGISTVLFLSALPLQPVRAQDMVETMLEQIAKFEVTLQELKQGYAIVQKGLTTIHNIKKGDFDIHSLFFSSLMEVNPAIKHFGKVADILSMQEQIWKMSSSSLQQLVAGGAFSPAELQYVSAVYSNLKTCVLDDIGELESIIADGDWQMSDDQRIARIDRLYKLVQEKYTFLKSFTDRARQQALLRRHEVISLQNIQKLFQP